jgi:GntR family transcriptional regulator
MQDMLARRRGAALRSLHADSALSGENWEHAVTNPSSGRRPLFLQAYDTLLHHIADGRWPPGQSLPAEGDLATELRVSPATVRKALDQLERENVVSHAPSRGIFVLDPASDDTGIRFSNLFNLAGERVSGDATDVQVEAAEASVIEAERLNVTVGAPLCRVRRIRVHAGRRFMVETAALPLAMFPGLIESGDIPLRVPVLCKRYGLFVAYAEEQVSLTFATADVAVALGVGYGTPTLILDRVLLSSQGVPLEYRVGHTLMTDLTYVAIWGNLKHA